MTIAYDPKTSAETLTDICKYLAAHPGATAAEIGQALGLSAGHIRNTMYYYAEADWFTWANFRGASHWFLTLRSRQTVKRMGVKLTNDDLIGPEWKRLA